MTEVAKIGLWYKIPFWVVVLFVLLVSLTNGLLAEEQTEGLVITSDRLEMDEKKATATFSGAVIAREGEMVISADRMEVYYYKNNKASKIPGGGVKQVLAFGQVILEQSASKGSADKAEYVVGKRQLTLIGKDKIATIDHAGDKLSGKLILLVLNNDGSIDKVSVLGGGRQRVSASIMPSSSKEKVEKKNRQRVKASIRPKSDKFSAKGDGKSATTAQGSGSQAVSKKRVTTSLPQLKQLYSDTNKDSSADKSLPLIAPKPRVD
ncbi:MAG: hypothetical protein HQL69_01995 [Magnetococcales bacterium]|nr:hypothetical protein [Magnetococcales bacterium]